AAGPADQRHTDSSCTAGAGLPDHVRLTGDDHSLYVPAQESSTDAGDELYLRQPGYRLGAGCDARRRTPDRQRPGRAPGDHPGPRVRRLPQEVTSPPAPSPQAERGHRQVEPPFPRIRIIVWAFIRWCYCARRNLTLNAPTGMLTAFVGGVRCAPLPNKT